MPGNCPLGFDGPKKAKLRQASRKIEREGFWIEERSDAQFNHAEIEKLSSAWLSMKSVKREARFLIRPFHFGSEPGVRRFFLEDDSGKLLAFIAFDPMCEDGNVIGYSPAIERRSPHAPPGSEEAITKFAIERFQLEEIKTLKLGMLPLFEIGKSDFREAWFLRKIFETFQRYGDRWIFNFRGHADFKHRFRGEPEKVTAASHTVVYVSPWSPAARIAVSRCGI